MVTIYDINQILPFVQWSKYRNWCCSCKHRYYCPVSNLKDDHSIPDFNNNNLYPYKYVRFNVILAMIKVGNKRQAYMRIKTTMPYATPWSTLLETNVISTSIATDFLLFIWKSRNTCSSVVISISLRSKYLVTMAESSKSGITSKWNREG